MKNKISNVGLTAVIASVIMVGCGNAETTPQTEQNTIVENETNTEAVVESGLLLKAHEAAKTALGEEYLPNTLNQEPELIQGTYGLDVSLCKEYVVEIPMIGFHPDVFIGVEAKEGQADTVEAALVAYKEQLLNDQQPYPANVAKVAAVDVKRAGNYIFLALHGFNGEVPAQSEVADEFAITPEEEAKINEQITEASKELTQKSLTAAIEALK